MKTQSYPVFLKDMTHIFPFATWYDDTKILSITKENIKNSYSNRSLTILTTASNACKHSTVIAAKYVMQKDFKIFVRFSCREVWDHIQISRLILYKLINFYSPCNHDFRVNRNHLFRLTLQASTQKKWPNTLKQFVDKADKLFKCDWPFCGVDT